jgi:ABC-type Fe3+/spermidine/putrescine transport system ATPase subunit
LRDVSFELAKGEVLALVGPSGSGKTSLAQIVLGLVQPTAGDVWIDGARVSDASGIVIPPHERRSAAVFQDLALWPHLDVAGNLEFALRARGLPPDRRASRVEEALEKVGLAGFESRRPQTLSGGEQQRVALARAMITEPNLLVLDEPFAGLDVVTRDEVLSLLAAMLSDRTTSTLVVTHDPDDVRRLASRLAVLEGGTLVQLGAIDELASSPATPFVRAFTRPR